MLNALCTVPLGEIVFVCDVTGEMTREELSSLLLNYLGTAADIIDFLSLLNEPNIVRTGPYLYAVLSVWTFSLMQVR